MKIVFDTNVIFNDWYLNKPGFEPFKMFLRLSGAKLVVPKLVIEEAKNKYREAVKSKFNSASKELKKLRGLLPSKNLSMPNVDFQFVFSKFEENLQERLIDLCAEMPGHSDVPHDDVIKRCLNRRKPFSFQISKDGEKISERGGYRDTLIWETILRKVADATYKTIFITGNHKDFGESTDSNEVHKHLREDLRLKGLPDDCIQLCDNLKAFNEEYAKPLLPKLIEEKPRLKEFTTLWFKDNRDLISEILQTKVDSLGWPYKLESYVDEPTISYIEDPSVFEIEEVYKLDADRVYIDIFMETDVNVDFFVHKYDYWAMSPNEITFDVQNEDWSKYSIWANIVLKEPISLGIIFSTKEGKVEKFEADFLEVYGHCKFCGEIIKHDAAEVCSRCGKPFIEQEQYNKLIDELKGS